MGRLCYNVRRAARLLSLSLGTRIPRAVWLWWLEDQRVARGGPIILQSQDT